MASNPARRTIRRTCLIVMAGVLLLSASGPVAAAPKVVLVAGDIARGQPDSQEAATAKLIVRRPSALVMTAGDNAYDRGTYQEFMDFYHPTWGQFRGRTRPTLGNHDYETPAAAGYFSYFGTRAGPVNRGYYTFRAGGWRIFALDSEACKTAQGCGPGSRQFSWLKSRLKQSRERCTLAVWHTPLHSSGSHGDEPLIRPLHNLLYRFGAEIVVNGHEHSYERLAPAKPSGAIDQGHGLRQFIVGTGGTYLRGQGSVAAPHSRVFDSETWGVLKLKLRENAYDWRFLPIDGQTFTDQGTGRCHGRPG